VGVSDSPNQYRYRLMETTTTKKQPHAHQLPAVEAGAAHFARHDRGTLVMACGTGKTLVSLWTAQRLGASRLLVVIPTLQLQSQTLASWLADVAGQDYPVLLIGSDASMRATYGVAVTTDAGEIADFLTGHRRYAVFCTYHSAEALAAACSLSGSGFAMAIFDEAHVTAGAEGKPFGMLLTDAGNVPIAKRLFMTATPRFFFGSREAVATMDDVALYGTTYHRYDKETAIAEGVLCDYKVLVLFCADAAFAKEAIGNQLMQVGEATAEAREWSMLYGIRQAMQQYGIRHILSFHASVARAERMATLAASVLTDTTVVHVSHKTKGAERAGRLNRARQATASLTTNAKALALGYDRPELDAVALIDPRQSLVEIDQMVGRVLRRHDTKPMGYVLLPVMVSEAGLVNPDDFAATRRALLAIGAADSRVREQMQPGRSPGAASASVTAVLPTGLSGDSQLLTVGAGQFMKHLSLRVWDRLKLFSWLSFAEARTLMHRIAPEHGIDTWLKFTDWATGRAFQHVPFPATIPKNPYNTYADQWQGNADWFGKEDRFKDWLSFAEARTLMHRIAPEHGIDTRQKFTDWATGRAFQHVPFPANMPKAPYSTYADQWQGYADWFGKEDKRKKPIDRQPSTDLC
jgi:superfamily II DNA or RNA helicase